MVEALRTAVIGCGGAGRNHARAYAKAADAMLVGVCDLDQARSDATAHEFGVPGFTSVEAMLEALRPDLVSVATQEAHHAEPTINALTSGAHVLCEKIMAASLADGRRMLEAAAAAGRYLAVNYNYRHMPVFTAINRLLKAGELGEPVMLVAQVHAFCWHHTLDLVRFLLGEPLSVNAHLDDRPHQRPAFWPCADELLYIPTRSCSATFTFANGVSASLSATLHTPLHEHMIDLSLYGTQARVVVNRIRPADTRGEPAPGPFADTLRSLPEMSLDDSFTASIHALLTHLQRGDAPPTSGHDGLATMSLENAVVRSASERHTVNMQLEPTL
ncbi:Gfo/Idh/MocA family protein [Phycisphaerales bacterium AB-hyl4]|uniref:Gfo/Idh/MocA family protein n=1 Tax=Natronomicrosphaera hydrolytica TaxID=3242702 RepID=A0ABV4U7G6_9BACT